MIGIVLVAHQNLAMELKSVLEHVVGPMPDVIAISIMPNDDSSDRRQDILDAIKAVDSGSGAVVLTDMFGGTPSNLAFSCNSSDKVEVIAGVNVPMLIKLASVRADLPLAEAVAEAKKSAIKYIKVASQLLT